MAQRNWLRIGFTERGDGGLDLSWTKRLAEVDGVIVVTKSCNPGLREAVIQAQKTVPVIVHAGCTGLGSGTVEPNVPHPTRQLNWARELVDAGLPATRLVIRVDPIIPNKACAHAANRVVRGAAQRGLFDEGARLRASILDDYRHVKRRFANAGLASVYEGNRFAPNADEIALVADELAAAMPASVTLETCAEAGLAKALTERGAKAVAQGCLSLADIHEMGLDESRAPATTNGQNRGGCLCLTCKRELLTRKAQCPHGCLYCYWKG